MGTSYDPTTYLNQQATIAPFTSRVASAAGRLRSSRLVEPDCAIRDVYPNDSPSLLCRGSSHPLDALPAYPVRPSSQSPVQDLSTAYSDGMRRPVSAGCIKLPRIDALK